MPIYSYRCNSCGNAFDVHQSFSDAALTVCPSCQGTLRKVFYPVGVVFKGSGFYRTDARKGTGAALAASSPAKPAGAAAESAAPAPKVAPKVAPANPGSTTAS